MSVARVKELRERTGLGIVECRRALATAGDDVEKAIEHLRKSSGMKAARKAGRIAAEGVVAARVSEDGAHGCMVEVNSETDFVARDAAFLEFVGSVAERAFQSGQTDVAALMEGALEAARAALVQKVGENVAVRRVASLRAEDGVVGSYVHGNRRIAVLARLRGGDAALARDVAMHVAAANPQVVRPADMPEEALAREREILAAQAERSGKPAAIVEKMVSGRLGKFLAENSLLEQPFVKDPEQTVGELAAAAGAEVVAFARYEVGEGIARRVADFAQEVAGQLEAG